MRFYGLYSVCYQCWMKLHSGEIICTPLRSVAELYLSDFAGNDPESGVEVREFPQDEPVSVG